MYTKHKEVVLDKDIKIEFDKDVINIQIKLKDKLKVERTHILDDEFMNFITYLRQELNRRI